MESAAASVKAVVAPGIPGEHSGRRCGRFSHGLEQLPENPAKDRVGRVSTGVEQLPEAPSTLRLGSFASGNERMPQPDRAASC